MIRCTCKWDREDRVSEALQYIKPGTWIQLTTDVTVDFTDPGTYPLPTEQYGSRNCPQDFLVLKDPVHAPELMFVTPEVQTVDPGKQIIVTVACIDPPYLLSQGTPIAQAFSLPPGWEKCKRTPAIFWTEVVGPNKLLLECQL